MNTWSRRFAGAAVALCATVPAFQAHAEDSVKAGILTCNVESGWGFVFGSSRGLKCSYAPASGTTERYSGNITKFGVDIGYASNGVIIWTVFAPSGKTPQGALAGDYAGASGSAAVGVGVGANALFGGFKNSVALQPVSIEGMTGLNVAAGISSVTLKFEP